MRTVILALALAAGHAPAPAAAQPIATITSTPAPYGPAPWWMREPVIASLGEVRAELTANRARFGAAFEVIDKSAAEATKSAADKVRALGAALQGYGPEIVRVATTFSTRPLYVQYKDKEGQIQENQRQDKVDRYAVTANVQVELRDTRLAERVYTTLIAARPTSTQSVYFSLQPSNETNTELFEKAVGDAARRAKLAAQVSGARLGTVKLIDPTGRACQTDVLVAGAPRSYGGSGEVQEVTVSGARVSANFAPPPPPPPLPIPPTPAPVSQGSALDPAMLEAARLPLQPPLQSIQREACVVYTLLGGPAG